MVISVTASSGKNRNFGAAHHSSQDRGDHYSELVGGVSSCQFESIVDNALWRNYVMFSLACKHCNCTALECLASSK